MFDAWCRESFLEWLEIAKHQGLRKIRKQQDFTSHVLLFWVTIGIRIKNLNNAVLPTEVIIQRLELLYLNWICEWLPCSKWHPILQIASTMWSFIINWSLLHKSTFSLWHHQSCLFLSPETPILNIPCHHRLSALGKGFFV